MPYTSAELRSMGTGSDDLLLQKMHSELVPHITNQILESAKNGKHIYKHTITDMRYWKFIPELMIALRKEFPDIKPEYYCSRSEGYLKFNWE